MQIVLPHTLSAVLKETRAHAYAMAMQVVVNPSSHWVALIVLRRAARNITIVSILASRLAVVKKTCISPCCDVL